MPYIIGHKIYCLKKRIQRFKRGYADEDWWDLDMHYLNLMPKLLYTLANTGCSYPNGTTPEEWKNTLYRMANLLERALYESTKACDSLDGYEKSGNISQECMNEHFDLMKKWYFDLWD